MANTKAMRLAVKLTKADAQDLRSAAVAVLPLLYVLEADFIAGIVILAYSPHSRERDEARQQMLRTMVSVGSIQHPLAG